MDMISILAVHWIWRFHYDTTNFFNLNTTILLTLA